jgi:hypothetical protein
MIRLIGLVGLFLEGWARLRAWRGFRRSWWSPMRSSAFEERRAVINGVYIFIFNLIIFIIAILIFCYIQIYLFRNK